MKKYTHTFTHGESENNPCNLLTQEREDKRSKKDVNEETDTSWNFVHFQEQKWSHENEHHHQHVL